MSLKLYTPGLKRKELYNVRKTRRLPIPGEVLVKEGDQVNQDTVIARTALPGYPNITKAAYEIGIDPFDLEKCMLKKVGEHVEKGEPLVLSKGLFGLFSKTLPSPFSGTLEHASSITGQVVIRGEPKRVEMKAYIPGRVASIIPREGAVIETSGAFVQGVFGVGGEIHGELMVLSERADQPIQPSMIGETCIGKVLVGGSAATKETLEKAVKVGAKGVIAGSIRDADLSSFLGYEIGVAITGQEEIGLTLIITEGFGELRMLERTFDLLRTLEGRLACINGATQIRAGVIRPEVIIPRQEISRSESSSLEVLRMGTAIRLIRAPYFGAIGKVVEMPVELQKLESGSEVSVLVAELEGGRRIVVPRANVEMIEE